MTQTHPVRRDIAVHSMDSAVQIKTTVVEDASQEIAGIHKIQSLTTVAIHGKLPPAIVLAPMGSTVIVRMDKRALQTSPLVLVSTTTIVAKLGKLQNVLNLALLGLTANVIMRMERSALQTLLGALISLWTIHSTRNVPQLDLRSSTLHSNQHCHPRYHRKY